MFSQAVRTSSRFVAPRAAQTPRLARSYAEGAHQHGTAGPEPINRERGPSRTPIFIGAALLVLAGGYFVGIGATPPTPAVTNMTKAMHPKTEAAQKAAGVNPETQTHQVGGDKKN
ncbi:uncharacterized protein JCM15063_004129 [Sporobolomyces koalae]|uniref:uncharacterized protein n=1 Tax=Sporobolomyces koalae TaxID=500713 RepID=UPI0031712469